MKQPLIILTGPTAVGKTALSIRLAKAIGGEIISADSMQVYRHMDIGSAKVTKEEMDGVPHHLIDVLEPEEEFNVVVFKQMATEALAGIYSRGNIPIVAGGTGFYIQALLYDIDFKENEEGSAIRHRVFPADRGADFRSQRGGEGKAVPLPFPILCRHHGPQPAVPAHRQPGGSDDGKRFGG